MRSFDRPIVLLAGGQDKHLPWEELADLMLQKTRAVVLFGQAADLIDNALVAARARRGEPARAGPADGVARPEPVAARARAGEPHRPQGRRGPARPYERTPVVCHGGSLSEAIVINYAIIHGQ